MRVIVPVFEPDLVSVLVGMRPVIVGVLVDDVLMFVTHMWVVVNFLAVGVLVIVGRVVLMFCPH